MDEKFVSVDSFLQELATEGQLDSAGQFTVSMEHAKEKLSEFLLQSTEEYLLKLVQAGVAAGASTLDLHSSTTRVRFCMHGVHLDPIDLSHILNHLLQPGQNRQPPLLPHLAIAVNTAIMTRATGMTLATWDGTQGVRFEWKASGRQQRPWALRTGTPPRVYFEVRRTGLEFLANFFHLFNQRDILSMLIGSRSGVDPDRLLVMDRAIWSPVPIRLNGRWLPKPQLGPIDGPKLSTREWLQLPPESPGIRGFDPKLMDWPWSRNYTRPVGGVVASGVQPAFDGVASSILWIYDGVITQSELLEEIPSGLFGWAVVPAYDCSSDVTGLSIVQNERFRELAAPAHHSLSQMFKGYRNNSGRRGKVTETQ